MKLPITMCAIFLASSLVAQNSATSPVETKGSCNGTAVGANITVTVRCGEGISKTEAIRLASQYAEILQRIKQEKLSFAQVNEKLDSIQKGVDTLRATAAGRHLTEVQRVELSKAVSVVPKNFMVVIGSADSTESSTYAEEIREIFVKDGTTRALGTQIAWHSKVIVMQIHSSDEQCAPYASALLQSMIDLGIPIVGEVNPAVHEGEIHVLVGEQP